MKKITCIGDIGIDKYINRDIIRPGGCTFNVAYHLKKASDRFNYNHQVSVCSVLGSDHYAIELTRLIELNGIINNCQIVTGESATQEIKILDNGEKYFVKWHGGVLDQYQLSDKDVIKTKNSDYIITLCYKELIPLFESIIKNSNAKLVCDFMDFNDISIDQLRGYISEIDILFFGLSSDETDQITQLKKISSDSKKLIIITLGSDGVIIFNGSESFQFDAYPVCEVVDTTGAGDTFLGTFMSHYISGESITDSAQYALESASQTVMRVGATDQLID